MKYENPKYLIAILYFAVVLIPLLSLLGGYFVYDAFISKQNQAFFMYFVMFLAAAYVSYHGIKFIRFIPAKYTLTEEHIEISNGKTREKFQWSNEMEFKNSDYLQLFWLYSSEKQAIAIVDHMMPHFQEFSEFIKSKISA